MSALLTSLLQAQTALSAAIRVLQAQAPTPTPKPPRVREPRGDIGLVRWALGESGYDQDYDMWNTLRSDGTRVLKIWMGEGIKSSPTANQLIFFDLLKETFGARLLSHHYSPNPHHIGGHSLKIILKS